MEGLVASVRAVGVVEPLTVRPTEDGKYQIITGHRRFRAAKQAGLHEVDVVVGNPQQLENGRQKSLVSSIQREAIDPVELAEALQSMIDDKEVNNQRELAEVLGKNEPWVSRILRILTLPVELQKKIRKAKATVPYDAIATIARQVKEPEKQKELVNDLIKGATNGQVREKIRQYNANGSNGNAMPGRKRIVQKYETSEGPTIAVQAGSDNVSREQLVNALQEALNRAQAT